MWIGVRGTSDGVNRQANSNIRSLVLGRPESGMACIYGRIDSCRDTLLIDRAPEASTGYRAGEREGKGREGEGKKHEPIQTRSSRISKHHEDM